MTGWGPASVAVLMLATAASAQPPARTPRPGLRISKETRAVNPPGAAAATPLPLTKGESEGVAANTTAQAAGSGIKLNYFETPWKKVLQQVAEATQTTLVADRIPPGRYNRRDKAPHTEAEALRILNRQLEPLGFRLIRKGDFLVLLDLPSMRANYLRPIIPVQSEEETTQTTLEEPVEPGRVSVAPRKIVPAAAEIAEKQPAVLPLNKGEPTVTLPLAKGELEGVVSEVEPQDIVRNVPLERHSAVAVGRMILEAFRARSELVDHGPRGLPALRVWARQAGNEPRTADFLIGIDEPRNQLCVQAAPSRVKAVSTLIETLDAQAEKRNQSLRLMGTTKDAETVATQLEQNWNLLAQAQQEAAQEPPAAPPRAADQPRSSTLLEGLQGNVTVESIPELGVIILRGNQKDVEALSRIIQEIESLSAAVQPEMEIVPLKNVSAEALAEVLAEAYGKLAANRAAQGRSVSILGLSRPNALLLIAAREDLETLRKLIEELDRPADPEMEFRVFRLRHAVPDDVVRAIQELYPAPGQAGAAQPAAGQAQPAVTTTPRGRFEPRVKVVAETRTNAVIVQARPRDLAEIAALIAKLDRGDSAAVNQVRIFPLKHALAEELAQTLSAAIQSVSQGGAAAPGGGGGGGAAAFGQGGGFTAAPGGGAGGGGRTGAGGRDVRSTVLQFLVVDGDREKVLRSGLLSDVRITANVRANSLVVTAPEQSMPLLGELIRQLDQPTPTVAEIKVFTLANGDANSMLQLLEKLFVSPQQREAGGIQVAGAEDASSSVVPMRFTVDARTNSIIAIGGADALRVVEAVLLRLDQSDIRQRQTSVFRLKNSPAQNVADSINQFIQSRRQQVEQTGTGLVSPFEQLEREVIVVPEVVSNSLLISATPRYFEEIQNLVVKLDAAPSQVIIQALLVEVALDNTDEFGIELGLQDSVLFNRSVVDQLVTLTTTNTAPNGVQTTTQNVISQTAIPGFLFNNQQLGNNTAVNPSAVGSQGLSNFSLGRTNGDLGFGGFVLSASSESISVLLRALSATRRVDILSRPQIRTLDNQLAQIQVGQQVPIVDGVNVTSIGNVNPLVRQDQAGIILTVTPRVSPDKLVIMEVIAEKSAFTGKGVPIYTDAASGRVIQSPIKDITTARTVVSVRNGQTIVLGGMITKTEQKETRKVPCLGDLPVIGMAFRYDSQIARRTELLIFLTPRLVRNDAEAEWIKQVEMDRLNFIECEAEQMHGPLRAVPAEIPREGEVVPPADVQYPGAASGVAPDAAIAPDLPVAPPAPSDYDIPRLDTPPDEIPPPPPEADPNAGTIQQMSHSTTAGRATVSPPPKGSHTQSTGEFAPPGARHKWRLRNVFKR